MASKEIIVFDKQNIKLYYLSPYVNITTKGKLLFIYNNINNNFVKIKQENGDIISFLKKGRSYEELYNYVKFNFLTDDPEAWIALAYQLGFIE